MPPLSISQVAKLCNFLLSPFSMTSNFLIPSFSTHLHFPCLSPLFFLHLSLSWSNSPFLNPSFSFFLSPLYAPPPLLFTPATHLSPSIRPSSGHPAITLHYRHIQHTNFTQNSTWVASLLNSHWWRQNSSLPHWPALHVDPRAPL